MWRVLQLRRVIRGRRGSLAAQWHVGGHFHAPMALSMGSSSTWLAISSLHSSMVALFQLVTCACGLSTSNRSMKRILSILGCGHRRMVNRRYHGPTRQGLRGKQRRAAFLGRRTREVPRHPDHRRCGSGEDGNLRRNADQYLSRSYWKGQPSHCDHPE